MFQQRIKIVKIHYRYCENFVETVRKVESFLGRLGGYVNKQKCRF